MQPKCKEFNELPLGRNLVLLGRAYFEVMAKQLEDVGIERYYSVLIVIENCCGTCSQQYISDSLKIDKVSLVRIIDYLIKKQFVQKTVNPKDRRQYDVQLTETARNFMPRVHSTIAATTAAAFKDFSPTEKQLFMQMIDKMYGNLENLPKNKMLFDIKSAKKTK